MLSKMTAALAGVAAVTLVAAPAHADEPTTVTASIVGSPDDGCLAWASDTFTRTTTITATGDGVYHVTIHDQGTFTAVEGRPSPNDGGVTVEHAVTGTLTGDGRYVVRGTLLGADDLANVPAEVDNSAYDCKKDVPAEVSTGRWPLRYFAEGATTDGITGWTWDYATGCEDMHQDESGVTGNIIGKTCSDPTGEPTGEPTSTPTDQPTGAPTTHPTTPHTTAGNGGGSGPTLPVTGTSVAAMAGIGGLLLAAGALLLLRRRRDQQFEA